MHKSNPEGTPANATAGFARPKPKHDGGLPSAPLNDCIAALPEENQQAALMLAASLVKLSLLRNDFAAALSLLEHVESSAAGIRKELGVIQTISAASRAQHVFELWKEIAVRDAILTVYHFGSALKAIDNNVGGIPSFDTQQSKEARWSALNEYGKRFPRHREIRDAVCHVADNTLTLEKVLGHVDRSGRANVGKLSGRTYRITKSRVHHSFELDQTALSALINIGNTIYRAVPTWIHALPSLERSPEVLR